MRRIIHIFPVSQPPMRYLIGLGERYDSTTWAPRFLILPLFMGIVASIRTWISESVFHALSIALTHSITMLVRGSISDGGRSATRRARPVEEVRERGALTHVSTRREHPHEGADRHPASIQRVQEDPVTQIGLPKHEPDSTPLRPRSVVQ